MFIINTCACFVFICILVEFSIVETSSGPLNIEKPQQQEEYDEIDDINLDNVQSYLISASHTFCLERIFLNF